MSKETTKATLLEAGQRVFLERGYNHSGIEAILQAAGVPKGSFYYYFESKEDFGLQVLDRFAQVYDIEIDRYLGDSSLGPLDRLRTYFELALERLELQSCRNGCLVGNLSQEMADQSEAFRARLDQIFDRWVGRFAECIELAQQAGEIPERIAAQDLSEFWLNGWQGAILRAKTGKSIAPLRTFLKIMFGYVLQADTPGPSDPPRTPASTVGLS